MPQRLTRTDTVSLLCIFCFRNHYSIPLSTWDRMSRPGLACVDCAGWSGSIHYAESIMLGFLAGRLICSMVSMSMSWWSRACVLVHYGSINNYSDQKTNKNIKIGIYRSELLGWTRILYFDIGRGSRIHQTDGPRLRDAVTSKPSMTWGDIRFYLEWRLVGTTQLIAFLKRH